MVECRRRYVAQTVCAMLTERAAAVDADPKCTSYIHAADASPPTDT